MPAKLFNVYTGDGSYSTSRAKITDIQTTNPDAWNSIIFDKKRHSIWAQGDEYGGGNLGAGNFSFTYAAGNPYTGNGANINNEGAGVARQFVTKVSYVLTNDTFNISYEYAYESSLSISHSTDSSAHSGTDTGDFVRGINVNGHTVSYTVNSFTTSPHPKNGNYVLTYAYINSAGQLNYDYRNLEGTAQSDFIYGFSQTADGKVSVQTREFTNAEHAKTSAQSHVITYTYIDNNGKLHADTRDLTGEASNDFIYGFSQTADGKVTVSTREFTNAEHQKTTTQDHVITYTYIDNNGKIHADYRDLSGNGSGDFIYGYDQKSDGKVTVSTRSFTNAEHSKTTVQPHVITYTYIDNNGKLHADTRDLSGSGSGNFLTGFSQTTDGKVSVNTGTFTNIEHAKTSTQSHVITYTYIASDGKLHADYRDLSGSGSGNFLTGFSQTTDGKVSVNTGTFGAETGTKTTAVGNGVIIGATITSAGKLSYSYRDLSGSAPNAESEIMHYLTGFSQDKSGKVSVTGGVFSNDTSNSASGNGWLKYANLSSSGTLTISTESLSITKSGTATSGTRFITGFTVNSNGRGFTYTHGAETQLSGGGTADTGKYISSISVSNHAISIGTTSLPTLSINDNTATSGKYISKIEVSGHAITVTKASLPSIPDLSINDNTATSGQYISRIQVSGHSITVTKADLPTIPSLNITGGPAVSGKYISELSVSGHSITVTRADLPTIPSLSITGGTAETNKYVSAISVDGHIISVTKATLPTFTETTISSVTNENKGIKVTLSNGSASVSNINVDKVDGYHIVVGSAGSASDTIYIVT